MRKGKVKVKNDLDQVLILFRKKRKIAMIFSLAFMSNAFIWGVIIAITVFLIPARGTFEIVFMIFWLSIWIPATLVIFVLFL